MMDPMKAVLDMIRPHETAEPMKAHRAVLDMIRPHESALDKMRAEADPMKRYRGMFDESALDKMRAEADPMKRYRAVLDRVTGGALADQMKAHRVGGAPSAPRPRTLSICCKTECMLCGTPMLASGHEVTSTSADELIVTVAVFPMCPTCSRRAKEDPSYWLDQLREMSRPRLLLIQGGGEGDGEPHGQGVLRLVDPCE